MTLIVVLLGAVVISPAVTAQTCLNRPGQCPTFISPFSLPRTLCSTDCDCNLSHHKGTWRCCPTFVGDVCLPPCNPVCPLFSVCTLVSQVKPWKSYCVFAGPTKS
ncbi:uncharacterized protein LOC119091077 [Pollicipes pollicipes]|uniref:uncharacterized protein LOC119091077 n=1 Tax=Pollicipes pollicipes TaxID=41117 RepID=UPI001885A35B|nr:uncharacterized protein LOC119091077 [Pollicipes pollicipes]